MPGARYTEVNDMKQERKKKKEKKRGKISFFYMHTELMMELLCVWVRREGPSGGAKSLNSVFIAPCISF